MRRHFLRRNVGYDSAGDRCRDYVELPVVLVIRGRVESSAAAQPDRGNDLPASPARSRPAPTAPLERICRFQSGCAVDRVSPRPSDAGQRLWSCARPVRRAGAVPSPSARQQVAGRDRVAERRGSVPDGAQLEPNPRLVEGNGPAQAR